MTGFSDDMKHWTCEYCGETIDVPIHSASQIGRKALPELRMGKMHECDPEIPSCLSYRAHVIAIKGAHI